MLTQLLIAPITLPFAGLRFLLERILEMAEQEVYDADRIREELLLLQLRLEEDEIDEEGYVEAEAEIMERLRAARAYHQQQEGK